jgi:hypothetical protein
VRGAEHGARPERQLLEPGIEVGERAAAHATPPTGAVAAAP